MQSTYVQKENQQGFTLIEVLVVIAIIGVLASVGFTNYREFTFQSYNTVAQADYRNIKTGVLEAASTGGNQRFVFRNITGPQAFPAPLQAIQVSEGVRATVVFDTRRRRRRRPRTRTQISVFHLDGSMTYRYDEFNGVVTEQEITR